MRNDSIEVRNAIKTMEKFREDMPCEYCPMEIYCEESVTTICSLMDDKIDELEDKL